MSKIALKGANTGSAQFTIQSPATNTGRTLTLPDETGTLATLENLPSGDITSGDLPTGSVLQVVQDIHSTQISMSIDNTFEDLNLSVSITPISANSKILIFVQVPISLRLDNTSSGFETIAIFRDGSNVYESTVQDRDRNDTSEHWSGMFGSVNYLDAPSTTSALTYSAKLKSNPNALLVYTNYDDTDSSIIAMEIAG